MGYCPSSLESTTQEAGTPYRTANACLQPSGSESLTGGSLAGPAEAATDGLFLTGVEIFFLLGASDILGGLEVAVGALTRPESPSDIQEFKCKLPLFRRRGVVKFSSEPWLESPSSLEESDS